MTGRLALGDEIRFEKKNKNTRGPVSKPRHTLQAIEEAVVRMLILREFT